MKETAILQDTETMMSILAGGAAILVLYMVGSFVMYMTKNFLDYRLKSKMVERGAPDSVLLQFDQAARKERKHIAIKSAIMLAGIGVALIFITIFPPLGIHSLMIMIFCISLSFLAYYYFIRKTA